jgi:multiple antibiotic resistance protein
VDPATAYAVAASHSVASAGAVFSTKLFTEVFVTLVVIMDPVGTIPLFLALTSGRNVRARRRLAWQAVVVAIAVIAAFALFGQQILRYLNISVAALQGAGGLLLVLVALELLTGKQDRPEDVPEVNVALVPLGTPLLAGPGAIVATMLFVQRLDSIGTVVAFAAAIIAVVVMLWLAMRFSNLVLRVLKGSGVELLTRIAGLLLSAIAVQLIVDAVRALIRTGLH